MNKPDLSNARTLQDVIDRVPNLVEYFFNHTVSPHNRDRPGFSPVPLEVTNWIDEQRSWRETAVLFDQSHHMPELFVSGPDAFRMLNHIGVNSFENFKPGMAKQFIACAPNGYFLGDCVMHYLRDGTFELISGGALLEWVQFVGREGDYDVQFKFDNSTSPDHPDRTLFRFELEGPAAWEIFDEVVEGETPELKFFGTAEVTIAGIDTLVLRHAMAGHRGVELSGEYKFHDKVLDALVKAGEKHGLKRAGTKTYFSSLIESGWIPCSLPAIYTGEGTRAFREWLPAKGWAANWNLGGSYQTNSIEDYYRTLWDMGYEKIVKFDHDFIGREEVERMRDEKQRKKVTFVWNSDDFGDITQSLVEDGLPYKRMELPAPNYGFRQFDEIRSTDGKSIGTALYSAYSANEHKMLSLGSIDMDFAEPGTKVVLVWGEPNGGTRKPRVERHRQKEVRVTVEAVPYSKRAQELKRATF